MPPRMVRPTATVINAAVVTLFELRRMLDGWMALDVAGRSPQRSDSAVAVLSCSDLEVEEKALGRNGFHETAAPLLVVSRTRTIRRVGQPEEIFNIGDARDRLALVARLAMRCLESPGARWSPSKVVPLIASAPFLEQVVAIQLAFDLHLTEQKLASRIDVDRATLRRWFLTSGLRSPATAMRMIRGLVLMHELAGSQAPFDPIARRLGFSSSSNARRLLSALTGLAIRELRDERIRETVLEALIATFKWAISAGVSCERDSNCGTTATDRASRNGGDGPTIPRTLRPYDRSRSPRASHDAEV